MFFAKVSSEQIDNAKVSEFGGPIVGTKEQMKMVPLINVPEALVGVEDFVPGTEVHWAFYHVELHFILQGKAEISYTLPPNYNKVCTRIVEKDDTYIIIRGARVTFKIIGDKPFRHYFVIMPRYDYERYLLNEEY